MAAYVNKYAKTCTRPGCGKTVKIGEGFITKTAGGWATWCPACCPEKIGRRVLTKEGHLFTPPESQNLPLVRSFPGARFHPNREFCRTCQTNHTEAFWSVSLSMADRLRVLEIADQLKLDVAPELRHVEQTQQASNAAAAGLYPYQVTGVNWLAHQERCILGDEMGLGKTIQTLVALPANAKVLVVCPSGLRFNWRDEAAKWRKDYVCTVIKGGANVRNPRPGEIVVISYDIVPEFLMPPERKKRETWVAYGPRLKAWREEMKAAHPDLKDVILVIDEAQKIKSPDSQRSLKCRELSFLTARTWALTGTPLLNEPLDLWWLLSNIHLNWSVFGTYDKFMTLYNATKTRYGTEWGMPTPEVPERMRRAMLQRKRAEVLPDLPAKTYTEILVSLDDVKGGGEIKKELDSLYEEFGTLMTVKEDLPPFTEFSKVREKLARACIGAMLEYVENCEEQGTKLVVASAHLAPLDELLGRENWAVISGATKPEERQSISVQQRRPGSKLNVACSISAAGVGLNLTGASKMLFVDLDWVPANNWQMEDRICRIGQTANKCEIVRFVVDHPLVRHVYKLLAKKIALIAGSLDVKVVPQSLPNGETQQEYDDRMKRLQEVVAEQERKAAEEAKAKAKEIGKAKAKVVLEREQERAVFTGRKILPLTQARIDAVKRAFSFMLSVCDGAVTRDAQGFNKPDAVVGHCILSSGLETADEVNAAYFMLLRYERQLKQMEPILWE